MFKRELSLLKQRQLKNKFEEQVNKDNIETITRFQLYLIFRNSPRIEKDSYLHNVIDAWWKTREEDYKSLSKLKRMISKCNISLNITEEENMLIIEERIFSIDRHIKDIGVNTKLSKKEQVGVKYTDAKLFVDDGDNLGEKNVGDLLVSNRRIIFVGKVQLSFAFKDIKSYNLKPYGFTFSVDDVTYVLRIHDQRTLNATMQNLIFKKNKALFKRGENNEWN